MYPHVTPLIRRCGIIPILAAVASIWVLAGCNGRSDAPSTAVSRAGPHYRPPRLYNGPARQLKKSEMTDAEIKYGIAPIPNSLVTYQPDVVVVGGGADAIRSQSSSGFIWTIDADAPHANELAEGKVLFLTNRAVGRILELRHERDALIVVVGPVDLPEIVSEAHIDIASTPIDLDDAISYNLPEAPGQDTRLSQAYENDPATRSAAYWPGAIAPATSRGGGLTGGMSKLGLAYPDGGAFLQPVDEPGDVSKEIKFNVSPRADSSGVGMSVSSSGRLTVAAGVLVHLAKPTIAVKIDISPKGGLNTASIELKGAAGLTWNFQVGSDGTAGAVIDANDILTPSKDFVINLLKDAATAALPIGATFRQRFSIKSHLGVRNSTLSATGDYTFKGGFKMGYIDGKWQGLGGPSGFSAKKTLVESTNGKSIALTSTSLGHVMTVIGGVGVAGFTAGPYVSFFSHVGVERNSDIGMLACNASILTVSIGGGAGYAIPESITAAINFLLHAFGSKKRISGYGGIAIAEPQTLINTAGSAGGCPPPIKQ
jgi:hypothetical protein